MARCRRATTRRRCTSRPTSPAGSTPSAQAIRRRAEDRAAGTRRRASDGQSGLEVPSPEIIYSTANDKSQIAFARLSDVLRRWTEQIGEDNLAASGVPPTAARPFAVGTADVADKTGHRGAAIWSKILPVLLLLWALTGAFYPAIDLCAGEKERGTLETLLSSPAQRSEIVLGKLLTIMLFSIVTAVLNLVSMGITGWMVVRRLPGFGLPPPTAIVGLGRGLGADLGAVQRACAWPWPPLPGAPRKGNTTSCPCCWSPCRW